MKALSSLKWSLISSVVTSGRVKLFVPILNPFKLKYDGGRVLEGPSFAGAGLGGGAGAFGFRRKLGREPEEVVDVSWGLCCGVGSPGPRSSVSEYGGGSSVYFIAKCVMVAAQLEGRNVAMESGRFGGIEGYPIAAMVVAEVLITVFQLPR